MPSTRRALGPAHGSKTCGAGKKSEQIWFYAVDGPEVAGHTWMPVEAAKAALADFTSCKTVAKFAARTELAFSGTTACFYGQAFERWPELRQQAAGSWEQLNAYLSTHAADLAAASAINVIEIDDLYGARTTRRVSPTR